MKNSLIKYLLFFCLTLLLLFQTVLSYSQSNNENNENSPAVGSENESINNNEVFQPQTRQEQNGLIIYFKKSNVDFERGELISNVLCIHNKKRESVKFTVELSAPKSWLPFNKTDRQYEVQAGDSVFVPIRLLPRNGFSNSTKYMFSAFLYDARQSPIGYGMFMAQTQKILEWDMTLSDSRIYLLKDETEKDFSLRIHNKGDDNQPLQIQAWGNNTQYDILDSIQDRNLLTNPMNITLDPDQDTIFKLKYKENIKLNQKKYVDLEDYDPYLEFGSKKHTIFLQALSANPSEVDKFRAYDRIEIIKLANVETVNPYGSKVLPIIMDLNIANVLGNQPIMNLRLHGMALLSESKGLNYSFGLPFSSSILGQSYQMASFTLGYFDRKFNVNIGNTSSGLIGARQSGKGASVGYKINNNNSVGIFYSHGPDLFRSPDFYTAGFNYNFNSNYFSINTRAGRAINKITGTYSNIVNLNTRVNFLKSHSITLRGGLSETNSPIIVNNDKFGYFAGAMYSGSFFNSKLSSRIGGDYHAPNFGISSTERLSANHQSSIRFSEKFGINLNNYYYKYNYNFNDTAFNSFIRNQINFTGDNKILGKIAPRFFYDISNISNFIVHSRGFGLGFSNYDLESLTRYYIMINGGYNRAVSIETKDRFFMQLSGYLKYNTWSFMSRYSLGNYSFSHTHYIYNSERNPQMIGVSVRNQYVLPFVGWVTENAVTYNYSTITGHNVGFYPELYYFTKNGWRFKVYSQWSMFRKSDNPDPATFMYQVENPDYEVDNYWNGNFFLGAGIKKEFGIPLPKTKNEFASLDFVAFYDLNGNGVKDYDEFPLENMVIRVDRHEVVTNERGEAKLINLPAKTSKWTSWSLKNHYGWFPNINDSISITKDELVYVPYTRGVHITGAVYVDLEEFSAFKESGIDVSNIMIFAHNHKTHTTVTDNQGRFSFYLPKGTYTLELDESILGQRFRLLQNNIVIEVDDSFDNIFIAFYVVEQRRKVRINRMNNN